MASSKDELGGSVRCRRARVTEVQAGWDGGKAAKREATAQRAPARQREAREDGEEARMRRARDALCRHSGVLQVEVRDTRRGTAPVGGDRGGVEPAVLGNHVGMASGGRWSGTRSDVERVEMENPLLTSPGDAELRHGTTQNPPRWGTGSRTPWGHRENFGDTMGTPQTPIEPHNCDLGSSFRPPETP